MASLLNTISFTHFFGTTPLDRTGEVHFHGVSTPPTAARILPLPLPEFSPPNDQMSLGSGAEAGGSSVAVAVSGFPSVTRSSLRIAGVCHLIFVHPSLAIDGFLFLCFSSE